VEEIGFTMSFFIGMLAFDDPAVNADRKMTPIGITGTPLAH